MTKYRIDPTEVEFYVLKGRKERSLAARRFFSRLYRILKNNLIKEKKKTTHVTLQTSA